MLIFEVKLLRRKQTRNRRAGRQLEWLFLLDIPGLQEPLSVWFHVSASVFRSVSPAGAP